MEKMSHLQPMNFGALCSAFQSTLPDLIWNPRHLFDSGLNSPTQEYIVFLLFSLLYTDKELETLEDISELGVTGKDASYYFHQKRRINRAIRNRALEESTDRIQKNIELRILSRLDLAHKDRLLRAIQQLVAQFPEDQDRMDLRDYLGLSLDTVGENSSLLSRFLAKCVRCCLLLPNTPAERNKLRVLNRPPKIGEKNDPYRLVSRDIGSSAVMIQVQDVSGYLSPRTFFAFDLACRYIMQKCLIIQQISYGGAAIQIHVSHFPVKGYQLRRLKKSEISQAVTFVRKHENEFLRKRSWGTRRLSEMVENGLQLGKWQAWGYFDPGGCLISFLDHKCRKDTSIELGVMLVDPDYRGDHLASSLLFFFELMYAHCRLFGGTYLENRPMINTFKTANFTRILYFDPATGEKVSQIKERIDPKHPDNLAYDTYSVYFYAESLLVRAFRMKQR